MEDLQLVLPAFSILLLVVVVIYRRFRRAEDDVPRACQAAAATALTLGVVTALAGVGHSVAVGSLALSEGEYGDLQVLRFTTGAMLVYSGAMNAALHRGIRVGQPSAIAVSAATAVLFCLYLAFHYPLPGNGGTVPPMLGLWTLYLLWLGAAAVASRRKAGGARLAA